MQDFFSQINKAGEHQSGLKEAIDLYKSQGMLSSMIAANQRLTWTYSGSAASIQQRFDQGKHILPCGTGDIENAPGGIGKGCDKRRQGP